MIHFEHDSLGNYSQSVNHIYQHGLDQFEYFGTSIIIFKITLIPQMQLMELLKLQ